MSIPVVNTIRLGPNPALLDIFDADQVTRQVTLQLRRMLLTVREAIVLADQAEFVLDLLYQGSGV
jgi:hypothetical protein